MNDNKKLFTIYKFDEEKLKIILNNVKIMLNNRIYITSEGKKNNLINLDNSKFDNDDDNTFLIKANNNEIYVIKIIFQKISATGKQSIISDFFKKYVTQKKIIIARDFNNKIIDYVSKNHSQIFKENFFLSDLLSYKDQPKFEILSPIEIEQFKKEYNATDYTTKKILRNDPVAKYFALKKDDVIRIIRPSPISGYAIDYRIVI